MEKRSVPFAALGGVFEKDDVEAATRVIGAASAPGGNFFPLPEENDFQKAFAAHEGARFAVAVNSCGTALDLCMMALGIGPGDEVITTGLTFICTATCAAARGAKIVFADIDPATLCLDPAAVERKITERTRAILPVHFAGLSCDVEAFEAMGRRHALPVIYDAAHAVSTKWKGSPVGRWGTASCYSFQSNKNMSTLGEGGAVVTDDPELAEKIRRMKTFGYIYGGPQVRIASIGFNYRMTKPQAAVGLTQLAKVDRVIADKRRRFYALARLLQGVDEIIPPSGIDENHGSHLFVIRLRREKLSGVRDDFRALLKNRYGVETVVHYPAVWSWEAAASFPHDKAGSPYTGQACESVVSLPVFPGSTTEDIEYIAWAVKQAVAEARKT